MASELVFAAVSSIRCSLELRLQWRREGANSEMEAISPRLSAAQIRVMRWLSQGWSAEPGSGATLHVNGQKMCSVDTMMALCRAGFVSRDDQGCWRATSSGRALRDRLPKS